MDHDFTGHFQKFSFFNRTFQIFSGVYLSVFLQKCSIVIEQGATYTAIWAKNQTSLVFDAGSGANFPNNGQKKEFFGSAGTELYRGDLIDPVMTGKTFEGWYTQETSGDKVETFTFPDSGSITYYAHWKDAEYTVTFNYNGGKMGADTSSTVKVTHGQSVTAVPISTNMASASAQ